MRKYRLVAYTSRGNRYLQIVRDVKTETGWTTKIVAHLGQDNEQNREKAEILVEFLKKYASSPEAPVAIGTIDQDFLAGLRFGILLGPLALPLAPFLAFRDLLQILSSHVARSTGKIEAVINATQYHLSDGEKKRLAEWIKKIPEEERALALLFKWSYK